MKIDINKADWLQKFILKQFYAIKLSDKANFFRLLALTQKAWLGMRDSLISIKKTETNKWLIFIITDIITQLTQGSKLSESMKNHKDFFKEDEIALIQSAETMGNMPEVLQEMADELENSQKIMQKIKKSASYPIILIVFAIAAVVILLLYVIPSIVTMFPSYESLPTLTKMILKSSDVLKKTRYLFIIGIIAIMTGYKLLYKYVLWFKIFIDKIMLMIPVISNVTKTFYMYRFTKLLAQLYGAGVSPIIALNLIKNSFNNFFYKKKMMEIKENLKAGFNFAESMEWSKLFDPILIQIIYIWEETGNIGEVARKISDFYRNLLQTKIDVLMGFLEPILMAVIAVIVGLIIWSIFLPMAELVNVIV